MATSKPPIVSVKNIKEELEEVKRQKYVDAQLVLRLLDYIEAREKLTKELLIHMNAVENHLVRVTELLQKIPQVNIGLLADALQAQIPKLDEIAYNTRKMVDYLELAVDVGEEPAEEKPKKAEKKPEKEESGKIEGPVEQLEQIEQQNKALIEALNKLSDKLKTGSE